MSIGAARDAIMLLFRTAWLADPASASVALLYDDVAGDAPGEDASTGQPIPFARITVQHTRGREETLGGVGVGRDLFTGTVVVQIFTPKGQGWTDADVLAAIALKAFQRKRFGGATDDTGWFYNVHPQEVRNDGAYAQLNVNATFRYAQRVT